MQSPQIKLLLPTLPFRPIPYLLPTIISHCRYPTSSFPTCNIKPLAARCAIPVSALPRRRHSKRAQPSTLPSPSIAQSLIPPSRGSASCLSTQSPLHFPPSLASACYTAHYPITAPTTGCNTDDSPYSSSILSRVRAPGNFPSLLASESIAAPCIRPPASHYCVAYPITTTITSSPLGLLGVFADRIVPSSLINYISDL